MKRWHRAVLINFIWWLGLSWGLVALGSPLVEERTITSGQFQGLEIGMNGAQVAVAAQRLGGTVISAIACRPFRISTGSTEPLPSFELLEGIRLTDAENHYEDIYFFAGKVIRVDHSPYVELVDDVSTGEPASQVRERLSSSKVKPGIAVAPVADTQRDGVVSLHDSAVADKLKGHACWRFEVATERPAGATYDIDLEGNHLQRVLYRRPRIRTE